MSKSKMKPCKSCGHEISAKGKVTCPNCGHVNKKPFYTKIWFILLVLVLGFGVLGSLGGDNEVKPSTETPSTPSNSTVVSTPDPEPTPIEPTDVIVDDLLDMLDENALKASNTYKDEYVRVTGILSNIDAQGDYFTLGRVDKKLTFISVMCKIDDEHLDQVMDFIKEQEVTVIGTISNVGEVLGYTLEVESIE